MKIIKLADNIYYSIIYWWQRRTRGFDSREVWNLDSAIIRFTLPRLKHFRKVIGTHPSDISFKQWQNRLDKMIKAMEIWENTEGFPYDKGTMEKEWKQGMALFHKYFFALWD